jgi:probable HAF family extracellular repeat protein
VSHLDRRLVIVASAALALSASGRGFEAEAQDEAITYDIRPLADLGGNSSRGNGINDSGHVTGFSNLAEGKGRRAVVWFNSRMFQLDPLGGSAFPEIVTNQSGAGRPGTP